MLCLQVLIKKKEEHINPNAIYNKLAVSSEVPFMQVSIGMLGNYPHTFLKKALVDIVITSVCLLCHLLLNRLVKSNQFWYVLYMQQHIFWSGSMGPWGGVKRANII